MKQPLSIVLFLALVLHHSAALWAGTAFTYQGRLDQSGQPYNGTVEMAFTLHDVESSGSQVGSELNQSVTVNDGLFQAELDFGTQDYENNLWLQISIDGAVLVPLHRISAVPLAALAQQGASRFATSNGSALAPYSVAMGRDARAQGACTVAMGVGTRAFAQHMVAIGRYNVPFGELDSTAPDSPPIVAGNGTSNANRSYALRLLKNGNLAIVGALTQNSDRNNKLDILPINPLKILDGVASLDVSSWRYKHSSDVPHIGPMAQDFHAAFGAGEYGTAMLSPPSIPQAWRWPQSMD